MELIDKHAKIGGISDIGLRSRTHLGHKQIKVRKESDVGDENGEPLSPMARIFSEPESDVYIITIIGFKNPIQPESFKQNLAQGFLKHPRLCSVQVANGGEMRWVQTEVDLDEHVIVPKVDDELTERSDKFVEDYIAKITESKMSSSIPMWDCHILNLKTSDAQSVVVLRVHHSLADGTSLMALLLSCSRKLSDPLSLPAFPASKKPSTTQPTNNHAARLLRCLCSILVLVWNTLVDVLVCVATANYLYKDTETAIKGPSSVAFTPRRIVRMTLPLADIKMVKNVTNTTVNDVVLAMTEAALSRYLNRKYGNVKRKEDEAEYGNNLPKKIRLTATLFVNLRSSSSIYAIAETNKKKSNPEWGNKIGYVLYPFTIALKENPLDYIRDVKAKMDRKKATFEAKFRSLMATVFARFYRTKLATFPPTTLWFSNVAGPQDEISIFGNQVAYIAPSLYGQPVALTIHVVSYAKNLSIVLSVDDNIIPDPYQLCDDLKESLNLIKKSISTSLVNC